MSDNTNVAEPITTSVHEPKAGVAEGTDGTFVVPEGCKPLPRKADGDVDWAAAGFEVWTHEPDGAVMEVERNKKAYVGAVFLRVADWTKPVPYIGGERLLAGLNGNGFKVMAQDVNRAYLVWLTEQKAPAWEADKTLKPEYRNILLQKIWRRYAGIAAEKRPGTPRVVERIVEVRVVSLPDGTKFEPDTGHDAEPLVTQLVSAWIDASMRDDEDADPGDIVAKAQKKLTRGDFHAMLGIQKPE
jgi:hypothetical protein